MLNSSVSPERARLAALKRYHILGTPPDPAFDRLTALAARLFAVPYAAINFVDADEVHFKSIFGLSLTAIPRIGSFCDCTLAQDGVFVADDARKDPRFQDNFLVTGPLGLRFYAGAPLRSPDGFTIGVLCLADSVPRALPEESRASLVSLADFVMREVELHQALHRRESMQGDKVAENGTEAGYTAERRDLPPAHLRLQKAYNELEAWTGHRTAALERTNRALEHEVVERERAEAALRAARVELEARITERTAALEHANQELRTQIAERQEVEKRLGESRQRYRSLFEQNRDAVYSFNREGRFLSANAACEALSGYPPQELLRMSFGEMLIPEHVERALTMFQNVLAGEAQHDELVITRKDGQRVEISVSKMPILINGEIVGAFGVSRDVTARRELERERERLLAEAVERADCDALTGLANHGAFHRQLHEALQVAGQSGQRLTVVLLDMDDFRFLNNAYGHIVGDAVLRQVAGALEELAERKSGAIVARYGGDQFAVLLPSATVAEADALALALTARLDFRPPGYDNAIPLALSSGAARFPDDGVTRQELLGVADTRLRRAKTGGAGQVDQLRTALGRAVEGFPMLDALVAAVDNKDRYTRRHSEDVLTYSLQIAEVLGLDEATRHTVAVAALLHDVGKIGVPDAILRKPGALTGGEFEAVKQHPMMGSVIVGAVPGFEETLDAVRHHHERWDGGGYPFGLSGPEIPLLARLMAVADAFSAMTTDRPYRKGMSGPQATALLESGSGSQWDPECVRAFLSARGSPGSLTVPGAELPADDSSCRSRADCG